MLTKERVFNGTSKQRQLFLWHLRIQKRQEEARKLGTMAITMEDIIFLNILLKTVSFHCWVGNHCNLKFSFQHLLCTNQFFKAKQIH